MSTFVDTVVECPSCSVEQRVTVAESLNGPRVPDIVEAILAGRFQSFVCNACYSEYVVDRPLVYIDFDAGHWIHMFPRADEPEWEALADEADRAFRNTMVEWAPPMVKSWGERMVRRTVFGLAALREKLTLMRAGLDDVAVEVLKLGLVAGDERLALKPLGADTRLRVVQIVGDLLKLEDEGYGVAIPSRVLDDIARDPTTDEALERLRASSFVDLARFA